MPSGVTAGDLLLVYIASVSFTATAPAGWTQLTTAGANGSIWWKLADGTEGASQTFGFSPPRAFSAATLRITGWDQTSTPAFANTAISSTTNYDPPSVTASWGSANNLFLASALASSAGRTVSTPPTNYAPVITSNANSGTAIVYERNLAAASDNPSTFTLSASGTGLADTIAVKPAPAVTLQPAPRRRRPSVQYKYAA